MIGDAYRHHFMSSSAVAKSLDRFQGALTTRSRWCERVDESETTDELGEVGGEENPALEM